MGFYPDGANAHFYEAEAAANWDMPWSWELGRQWRLKSRADFSAGWLGQSGVNAALLTGGPSLVIFSKASPFSIDAGVSPTILSRYDFPSKNLGEAFQFTSHVGASFDIASRVRVGYRFQHLSNAGLSPHNPGLNLHFFGMSYLF